MPAQVQGYFAALIVLQVVSVLQFQSTVLESEGLDVRLNRLMVMATVHKLRHW